MKTKQPTSAARKPPDLPVIELRSPCPIGAALEIVGDRWTLLLIRDLLFAKKTKFAQFEASPERIPSNVLADRLKKLESAGIVTKQAYQLRPTRYEYHLTPAGSDLFGVLAAMVRWGSEHLPNTAQVSEARLAEMAQHGFNRPDE